MGHIQAAKDFTAAEALAAEQARVALKGQLEGYADTAEADAISSAGAYTDGREVVLQGNIDANTAAHDAFKATQEGINVIQNTFNGDIGMDVVANKTASEAADAVLTAGLAQEVLDRTAAVNGVTVSLATEATTARAAELANANAISAEASRAATAEAGLQGSIDGVASDLAAEAVTARAAESANATAISAEQSRAEGQETLIRGEFAAADAAKLQEANGYTDQEVLEEKTRALAAESGLQSAITAEASTARAAEVANAAAISAEETRALAAETQLANALAQEETDRLAGEAVLEGKIDTEKGRIDAILLASDADKDSFAEIVTLVNSIDAENDQAFAGHVSAYNAKMAELDATDVAEEAARIAGDAAVAQDLADYEASNDAALAAEVSRAGVAEAALQAGLDAEIAATNADFATAATDRGAIRSEFAAADSAMETAFTAEIDALKVQDGSHTSDISANAAAIVAEAAAARLAEAANAAAVVTEKNRAEAQEAAIRSEFAAADVALKGQMEIYTDGAVDGEKVRAQAAEAVNAAAVVTEKLRAEGAEAGLQGQINTVDGKVDAEKLRAEGVEAANAAAITAENVRALAAELALDTAYKAADATEEAARIAGDAGLQGQIDTVDGKVDAEKVRAEAAELALSNGLSAEQQRAQAAEAAIQADVDANEVAAIDAISAEETRALAAEAAIQADVDANEASASGSFADALAARGVIAGNLAQELLDRAAGDEDALSDAKAYTDTEIGLMGQALNAEILATNADFASATTDRAAIRTEMSAADAATLASANTYTDGQVAALVDSSPALLDTLNELAAAIGDDENFAATVASDIATAKAAVELSLSDHEAANVVSFAAASTDRADIRTEMAAADVVVSAAFAAADAAALAASIAAAATEQTLRIAAEDALAVSIADEIANRVAGDQAEATARVAAVSAEETARIAGDNALTASLNSEVTRATGVEAQLQSKITDMHDGETTVKHTPNAVASASIMLLPGFAHHIVVNSGASAMATLPVLGANFKMTLSLAASSSEAMEFHAPAGFTIDGEADGKITLYAGASVSFVEHAGVYYMM